MCADDKYILIGTSTGTVVIMQWKGEVLQIISSDFFDAIRPKSKTMDHQIVRFFNSIN
jgi:hypothetical protein